MPLKPDGFDGFKNPKAVTVEEEQKWLHISSKIELLFLDVERNPIKGMKVELSWNDKTVSAVTPENGLIDIDLGLPNVELIVRVGRISNKKMKELTRVTSGYLTRRVTLRSGKLLVKVKTKQHPKGAIAEKPKALPKPHNTEKKADGALQSAWSWREEIHGIRTKEATDKNGIPVAIVTGDQPKLEFLDVYTGEKLSEEDYEAAARELRCEVEVIKAIEQIESQQSGFDGQHRPIILYERHYFSKNTQQRFDKDYPDISARQAYQGFGVINRSIKTAKDLDPNLYPNAGGQNINTELNYQRLVKAYKLNKEAALKACSWGKFQVMGENYNGAFASVEDMVKSISKNELGQLKAFISFVKVRKLQNALREKNWTQIAIVYNGKFQKNYDVRLKNAYYSIIRQSKQFIAG
jgi:hypothetical protein